MELTLLGAEHTALNVQVCADSSIEYKQELATGACLFVGAKLKWDADFETII